MRSELVDSILSQIGIYQGGGWLGIRVLVAFDDEYRIYREMIASGISLLRPEIEVTSTNLNELEREIARLDPQVVICSRGEPASKYPELTWIEGPIGTDPQSEALTLETLLAVIDESQEARAFGELPRARGGELPRARGAHSVRPSRRRS
jgi:hypothetical protein